MCAWAWVGEVAIQASVWGPPGGGGSSSVEIVTVETVCFSLSCIANFLPEMQLCLEVKAERSGQHVQSPS